MSDQVDDYRVDIGITDGGDLDVLGTGGLALRTGPANAAQALVLRLRTARGDLPLHPEYGSMLEQRLTGAKADPVLATSQVNLELREAISADPRFAAATNIVVGAASAPVAAAAPPDPNARPGGPRFSSARTAPAALQDGLCVVVDEHGTITALAVEPGPLTRVGRGPALPGSIPVDGLYFDLNVDGLLEGLTINPGPHVTSGTSVPATMLPDSLHVLTDNTGAPVSLVVAPAAPRAGGPRFGAGPVAPTDMQDGVFLITDATGAVVSFVIAPGPLTIVGRGTLPPSSLPPDGVYFDATWGTTLNGLVVQPGPHVTVGPTVPVPALPDSLHLLVDKAGTPTGLAVTPPDAQLGPTVQQPIPGAVAVTFDLVLTGGERLAVTDAADAVTAALAPLTIADLTQVLAAADVTTMSTAAVIDELLDELPPFEGDADLQLDATLDVYDF